MRTRSKPSYFLKLLYPFVRQSGMNFHPWKFPLAIAVLLLILGITSVKIPAALATHPAIASEDLNVNASRDDDRHDNDDRHRDDSDDDRHDDD